MSLADAVDDWLAQHWVGAEHDRRLEQHLLLLQDMLHMGRMKLEHHLVTALLISFVSHDFNLALLYILTLRPSNSANSVHGVEGALTDAWEDIVNDGTFLLHCLLELLLTVSPCSGAADRFLMDSILVRRVMDAASRGVTMALGEVIDQYIGLWMSRAHIGSSEAWLTKLAYHQNTRRKFGVRLRATWNLHCGCLRSVTCVDETLAKQKAAKVGNVPVGNSG